MTNPNLTVAAYIEHFVTEKAASKEPYFFANALRKFVEISSGRVPAPGSTDRILRKLRQAGKVDYVVVNRATSYYLAKPLTKEQTNG
jgi:hypothetical protein